MRKPKTVKITKRVLAESEGDATKALRRVVIKRDSSPYNPREEEDNLFTIYSESRYLSGDKGALNPVVSYGNSPDEAKFTDGVCAFPIYALVHSGRSLSLSPFNDPWDSGCAGFIYVNKAAFCEAVGLKRFSTKRAYEAAKAEIAALDQYDNGEVYGYETQTRETPEEEWQLEDSCWGYFGDESIPDMVASADGHERGTIICKADDVYIRGSEVTMEVLKPTPATPVTRAA